MTDIHNLPDISDEHRAMTVDEIMAAAEHHDTDGYEAAMYPDPTQDPEPLDDRALVASTWDVIRTTHDLVEARIEALVAQRLEINATIKDLRDAKTRLSRMVRITDETATEDQTLDLDVTE